MKTAPGNRGLIIGNFNPYSLSIASFSSVISALLIFASFAISERAFLALVAEDLMPFSTNLLFYVT